MTPQEFEIAVATDFANQGFEINHIGKSYYKGVDFIAFDDETRIAVKVKMYESRVLRYQEFMYLYAGQKLYDFNKSLLVTVNTSDKEAKEVAKKLNVDFIENYSLDKTKNSSTTNKATITNQPNDISFFELWQRHIKPLKGQRLPTATGKENIITNVTNDFLYRKSSTGSDSKIDYKTFETVYHRLLLKGQ